VQEALSSSPSVPMTGGCCCSQAKMHILLQALSQTFWLYTCGARDKAAIAEQIAAYVTLHIKPYEPEDHRIKEYLL
jgi:hypothetical protein